MTSIYNNYSFNSSIRIPSLGFKKAASSYSISHALPKDGYISNPLYDKLGTKFEIEAAAKNNQRVQEIMHKYDLPININEKEFEKLKSGHLQDTRIIAAKIYSNLPSELKNDLNLQEIQEAAMFHDYGKVLIPENIINKKGELNEREWEIMRQHSELGAELLKGKNVSPRVSELVKYHHYTRNGDGYPVISNGYEFALDSEILSVADKYQALVEKRSYKNSLTKDEALAEIKKDVDNGLVSIEVFDALKKSV